MVQRLPKLPQPANNPIQAAQVAKMVGACQSGEKGHPLNGSEAAEAAAASNHPIQAAQVAKLVGASQSGEKGHPPNGSEAAEAAEASNHLIQAAQVLQGPLFSCVPVTTSVLQHASPWPQPPTITMRKSAITTTPFSTQEPPQRHPHMACNPCRYDTDDNSNQVDGDGDAEGNSGDDVEGNGGGDVEGNGGGDAAMGTTQRTTGAVAVAKLVGASQSGEKGHPPNGSEAAEAAAASNHPIQAAQVAKLVGASQSGEKGHPPNGSEAAEAAEASNSSNPSCPRKGVSLLTLLGMAKVLELPQFPKWFEVLDMMRRAIPLMVQMLPKLPQQAVLKIVRGSEYGENGHPPNGPDAAEAAAGITPANPSCLK
ncbi:hypothetical protein EDB83DRAFT_2538479 [Lactarius deliciosus]|nr:hypothetical protein EDB83DRAFT_2538479 [Lactarius deliciosus]